MARVHTSDQTWSEFRAAAGQRPLDLLLGELVERHVQRWRSQQLRGGALGDAELVDALDRARELHADIVVRLEHRLDPARVS